MKRILYFFLATLLGLATLLVFYLPFGVKNAMFKSQMGGVVFFFALPWLFFLLIWYVVVRNVRFLRVGYQNNIIPLLLIVALPALSALPFFGLEDLDRGLLIWDLMTYLSFFLSLKFVLIMERRRKI